MNNLIELINGEARVSHRILADKTENKILSIQKLITERKEYLEKFAPLRFKSRLSKTL